MTPPQLDVDACQEKLALLVDLLTDLDRQPAVAGQDLRGDRDRRHIIERILTQLVDIAASLNALLARGLAHRSPTGYRDSFELLRDAGVLDPELTERLLPSVGMRNLLTHEYGSIDLDRLASAVPRAREDHADYAHAIRTVLLERG